MIPLYTADFNRNINVKVLPLCATCDLPAKALFLCMKQYNSLHGCHKCRTRTVAVGETGAKRVYKQVRNLPLRTSLESENFAAEAVENNCSIFGVKGPTYMSIIFPEYIDNFVLDPMHMLSGIGKLLLKIWFMLKPRDHEASISKHLDAIRQRILSIAPPSFVSRLPRKIDDFAYWKASEIILRLLVYSIVLLNGKMDVKYLEHHKLLVYGIYLLYQKSVSQDDIKKARRLLQQYVGQFDGRYSLENMVFHIYSLLHLADLVEAYGPLWVFTNFPFENANGILKLLVHATRNAQIQICLEVSLYLTLDVLKKSISASAVTVSFFMTNYKKEGHIGASCIMYPMVLQLLVVQKNIQ